MLWREHYEPRILEDLDLPNATPEWLRGGERDSKQAVWIGGFGLNAVSDQGVWWRLMQSEFHGDPYVYRVFIQEKWTIRQKQSAMATVPPSEHVATILLTDAEGVWQTLVQPDKPERGFAALVQENRIVELVIGPPTEDVWEAFSNRWRSVRT